MKMPHTGMGEEAIGEGAGQWDSGYTFWMCVRHPSGSVSEAVGYASSELPGELRVGDINGRLWPHGPDRGVALGLWSCQGGRINFFHWGSGEKGPPHLRVT